MRMEDKLILEYINSGGFLFQITNVDTYRDGGTIGITTSKCDYYLHQKDYTLHSGIPCSLDNMIIDHLLFEYLLDRLSRYYENTHSKLELIENTRNKIIELKNGKRKED